MPFKPTKIDLHSDDIAFKIIEDKSKKNIVFGIMR